MKTKFSLWDYVLFNTADAGAGAGGGAPDPNAGAGAAGGAGGASDPNAGAGGGQKFASIFGNGQQKADDQKKPDDQQQKTDDQQKAPEGGSWWDKLTKDQQTYAQAKGWTKDTDPSVIFNSYASLESVWGADKAGNTLKLPKDDNDLDGFLAIKDKLGRPKEAKDYDLGPLLPEGADQAFADRYKEWAHKAGLTQREAKEMAAAYRATELEMIDGLNKRYGAEIEALKTEWGQNYDQRVNTVQRAIAAANLTPEHYQAIEQAIGPGVAAKIFEFYGRNYVEGEPPADGSRMNGFGVATPAAAKAKMDALYADKVFMDRYQSDDPKIRKAAVEEMDALAKLAARLVA